MPLKDIVDQILKEKVRPLSWLAEGMGKTFDGLKLSLVNGSIKYKDILAMSEILEVSPAVFFKTDYKRPLVNEDNLSEPKPEYGDLKSSLKACKELTATLKDQIKDKDRIIALLDKQL